MKYKQHANQRDGSAKCVYNIYLPSPVLMGLVLFLLMQLPTFYFPVQFAAYTSADRNSSWASVVGNLVSFSPFLAAQTFPSVQTQVMLP